MVTMGKGFGVLPGKVAGIGGENSVLIGSGGGVRVGAMGGVVGGEDKSGGIWSVRGTSRGVLGVS